MIYYIDSSCLVKRYVNEIGSEQVLSITDPVAGNEIYTARITCVEVISAVSRRKRDGTIASADAAIVIAALKNDLLNEYQIVEVTEQLVNRAMTLVETYGLRSFDAVQLAAACEVQALCIASGILPLSFLSADKGLNAAATAEGLSVDDPNTHS